MSIISLDESVNTYQSLKFEPCHGEVYSIMYNIMW
jgi:hypothetical protein